MTSLKDFLKMHMQIVLALLVSLAAIALGWTDLYQTTELKLLDSRFRMRRSVFGVIPMHPDIATLDVNTETLEREGRWQDWTRDKHARIIDLLAHYGQRMTGFDIYFIEPSAYVIPGEKMVEIHDLSREEILGLLGDHDAGLARAMERAGNIYLAQLLTLAENQDSVFVVNNTKERTPEKEASFEALMAFSFDYPAASDIQIPKAVDIAPPLPSLTRAAAGVGFASPKEDIDGIIRRYQLGVVYEGRFFPALALIMACDYLQVPLGTLEILPGRYVRMPDAHLPNGEIRDIDIPINRQGEMLINWAGDYSDTFLHIPYWFLADFPRNYRRAQILREMKRMIHEDSDLADDPDRILALGQSMEGFEDPELVQGVYADVFFARVFEGALQADPELTLEEFCRGQGLPAEYIQPEHVLLFNEIRHNLQIKEVLASDPDLSLEEVADSLGVKRLDDIRRGYHRIRTLLLDGDIGLEHHPLYFYTVSVAGREITPADLKGKVFFYGITAPGGHDLNPTPYSSRYPMLGLHANVFNAIVTRNLLRAVPRALNIVVILALGMLIGLVIPRLRALPGAGVMFGVLVLYAGSAFLLFAKGGIWIDELGPILTLIGGYLTITLYNYIAEERQKNYIHGAFGRYLAPAVVDQIVQNPEMLDLGGRRKEMTAFFSDVQGFTSISEELGPVRLVRLLNIYLGDMTDIIDGYGGTVDKFEGDAILAFYGDPGNLEDHARRACLACLDMQARLIELRERWRLEDEWPESVLNMRARMGMSSGPIMVGNMGSRTRMDYTMMGDTVNLAARLEPSNKEYGTYIMISEFTYEPVKDFVETRNLDTLRVVGKDEATTVYQLLSRKGELDDATAEVVGLYDQAMALYRDQRWDDAIEMFHQALRIDPEDAPSQKLIARCEQYKVSPPPEDWDGVYRLESKG